jgi:hypothetical protein
MPIRKITSTHPEIQVITDIGTDSVILKRRGEPVDYSIPRGVIVMWSGQISQIPTTWALCNGTNGTPDLVPEKTPERPGAVTRTATLSPVLLVIPAPTAQAHHQAPIPPRHSPARPGARAVTALGHLRGQILRQSLPGTR